MNDNERDPATTPLDDRDEPGAAGCAETVAKDASEIAAPGEHGRAVSPPPLAAAALANEQRFKPLHSSYATEAGGDRNSAPIPQSLETQQAWGQGAAIPAGGFATTQLEQAPAFGGEVPSGLDGATVPPGDLPDEWATPRHRKHAVRTLVREVVETGLLALLVFLAVRASFQNFKVDGTSMYPTLENGEFLIVNKLVYAEVNVDKLGNFIPFLDAGDTPIRYLFHGPERGDIIVLKRLKNHDDLIKRVIGLPGETLEIVNGQVYINGFLLEEPYITKPWRGNYAKITIPAGEYFVMGDNRDNSLDSRSASVGLVSKDLVIGKALLSYWPTDKFGLAPNESPKLTNQPVSAAAGNQPATGK